MNTAVDITDEKGGFSVKFDEGLRVLVGQTVPTQLFNVCSCFPKMQQGKVEEDSKKLSDVKEVIRESLLKEVESYAFKQGGAKLKGNATAGKTHSAIKAGNNLRIMYRFAEDLQHKDVNDLKNGKHFTGDDFSHEESTDEDRSAPDEDAQTDLLMRACCDGGALSNLPVQHLHEPRRATVLKTPVALLMNEATALEKV